MIVGSLSSLSTTLKLLNFLHKRRWFLVLVRGNANNSGLPQIWTTATKKFCISDRINQYQCETSLLRFLHARFFFLHFFLCCVHNSFIVPFLIVPELWLHWSGGYISLPRPPLPIWLLLIPKPCSSTTSSPQLAGQATRSFLILLT